MHLVKGSNAALPAELVQCHVVIRWEGEPGLVDGSVLLLDGNGRVRSDEDFVFYNQPTDASGAVSYLSTESVEPEQRLAFDLEALDDEVRTIAIIASCHEGLLASVEGLRLEVVNPMGEALLAFETPAFSVERALLSGELYRRDGGWKLRAVGQGWSDGLAGLARDFGVVVDDGPAEHEEPTSLKDVEKASASEDLTLNGDAAVPPQRRPKRSVQTRKSVVNRDIFTPRLAEDPAWQEARLFPVSGVGTANEQEKRATSALLATLMGVKPFARALLARVNAPAGAVESFLEVGFAVGDSKVIPDGVIRVSRGSRLWTALVEVKTGTSSLRSDQVQAYVDVARRKKFDVVITLSNDLATGLGEQVVNLRTRKGDPLVHHISWSEVLHEARMTLNHRGMEDRSQAWILHELIRYLEHPRSGAASFEDMGVHWVPVREAAVSGTLRASDRKVPFVAEAWQQLVRQVTLNMTAELGLEVVQNMPRKLRLDAALRVQSVVDEVASTGSMSAGLSIPGAAGPLSVRADLRTSKVEISTQLDAPPEGGSRRRVSWLLKQLEKAPEDVLVEVVFDGDALPTCEKLSDARRDPKQLVPNASQEVAGFNISRITPMGTKRSGTGRTGFPASVQDATAVFYRDVLSQIRMPSESMNQGMV